MSDVETRDQPVRSDGGSVKSATRVLDLFEFLSRWDAERTHTEIADELRIPKSSLTQLLRTLVSRGYLRYVAETKGYALGTAISALARKATVGTDIIAAAQDILPWVTSETQETCALNFLKGDMSEVVASSMGKHRLLYTMRVGDTAPLYATSGGKAILAYLPPEMLREYLARVVFEKITATTIGSTAQLTADLEGLRERGYAFVNEEFTPGVVGMARPILSASGFPLAAVHIVTPRARFDDDKKKLCLSALDRAIDAIRYQLRIA